MRAKPSGGLYAVFPQHRTKRSCGEKCGGEDQMTSKELLYVEDALGHEKYFQTKCMEAAAQKQDEDLKQWVTQMAEKHRQLFRNFYGLL